MSYDRAYTRLHTMGDWLEMQSFSSNKIMAEV